MAELTLTFANACSPELVRTKFEGAARSSPRICVRGRTPGALDDRGTFQWTAAVQALCVLLLRSAAARRHSANVAAIEGGPGSLASSLDASLAKCPPWLIDMFGRDAGGAPLARRLISRCNMGLRRPGPAVLSLARFARQDLKIAVHLDNQGALDGEAMLRLASRIEDSWRPHHRPILQRSASHNARLEGARIPGFSTLTFETLVRDEVLHSLRASDIFSRRAFRSTVSEFRQNPSFLRVAGKRSEVVSEIEQRLFQRDDLGYCAEESLFETLRSGPPITVNMVTVPAAACVLCSHLKFARDCEIVFDTSFRDSSELLKAVENRALETVPDLIIAGIASGARLLSGLKAYGFAPLTFIPKYTSRIVAPRLDASTPNDYRARDRLRAGRYLCSCEAPTSATFTLDRLQAEGVLKKSRVKIEHAAPGAILQALASGDPSVRAIVHSPYHQINVHLKQACYLDTETYATSNYSGLLLAHESFMRQERRAAAFVRAFRNSWLDLRNGGDDLDFSIRKLLNEPGFNDNIVNFSGIAALQGLRPQAIFASLPANR